MMATRKLNTTMLVLEYAVVRHEIDTIAFGPKTALDAVQTFINQQAWFTP